MSDEKKEFSLGPFSIGDLIALASEIFFSGGSWFRMQSMEAQAEHDRIAFERLVEHVQTAQLVIPQNYVRRDEYQNDLHEIKEMLRQIARDKADKD